MKKKENKNNEVRNENKKKIEIVVPNKSYMENKEIFTKRFNEILTKFIEEGHQQRDITKDTGISPASITQYKNGTNVPKGYILENLANYFNVSANYLLGKSDTPTYSFDDINKKTGLSQKAIMTLYKLHHNCLDEDIDITEERKISDFYNSQLSILNLILENSEDLLMLLEDIKKYQENYKKLKSKKDELDFYEYKITKDFIQFLNKLIMKGGE